MYSESQGEVLGPSPSVKVRGEISSSSCIRSECRHRGVQMGQYEGESTRNRPESVSNPISLVYEAMNMHLVASAVEKLTDRCWPPLAAAGPRSRETGVRVARSPTGMV